MKYKNESSGNERLLNFSSLSFAFNLTMLYDTRMFFTNTYYCSIIQAIIELIVMCLYKEFLYICKLICIKNINLGSVNKI